MKKNRIRLTEQNLHRLIKEAVIRTLNEMEGEEMPSNPPYEEWSKLLRGKSPLFQFHNEETDDWDIVYVDYNEKEGTLETGGVTNIGFHPDGEVSIPVEDGNFQAALEAVYEELSEIEYQKGFTMD